mgnify:CR=1 FL=1
MLRFCAITWPVMMSLSSVGWLFFDNFAIRRLAVQLKYTGSTAKEFAELAVDAQGNRCRSSVMPGDRERVAREPKIE